VHTTLKRLHAVNPRIKLLELFDLHCVFIFITVFLSLEGSENTYILQYNRVGTIPLAYDAI
jgi:hypothetical protein